jgi:DNA-binding NtrC family response regulator
MIARDACGVPRRGEIDMNHAEEGVGIDSAKGRTILIMEDEPSLAEGLKMVLSEQGYRVSVAEAGLRALGSLAERDYDLLVMDLRLPDMDGMEVLRLIKETKPETAVIVMTGYATVASAMESMKLGALDYLPKPFTEDEFKAAVEKALTVKKEVFSENK